MATQVLPYEQPLFPSRNNNLLLNVVIKGMCHAGVKSISPMFLYSDEGMRRYDLLCSEKDTAYYLIAAEEQLLQDPETMDILLAPLFEKIGDQQIYNASLGPGNGHKDRFLFEHLVHVHRRECTYAPVDVCAPACMAAGELVYDFACSSRLSFDYRAIGMEFIEGLRASQGIRMPRLITYFGSTFGNFMPPFNLSHLSSIAASMAKGNRDHLLMGVDMAPQKNKMKSIEKIEAAYNTAPTVEWVMYLFDHINGELGTNFSRRDFSYHAYYDGSLGGIRTAAVANKDIEVPILGTEHVARFRKGEELQIEVSMKYKERAIKGLFSEAGLEIVSFVENPEHLYRLYLLRNVA
jgi:uncharacterized SAM-dependent methyltransferase